MRKEWAFEEIVLEGSIGGCRLPRVRQRSGLRPFDAVGAGSISWEGAIIGVKSGILISYILVPQVV